MLALAACDTENHQVIELLKVSSELSWLNVTAYADDFPLTGGATVEPGLRPGVFNYTVYLAKDANRFTIDAGIGAVGTVVATSEADQITGTDFDYLDDQPKIITLTVEREYMKLGNYRLTVVRADAVPVAENIKVIVDPEIGAFFIGSNVLPNVKVTADLPAAGGTLSYQWYLNTVDLSVGGYQISGETGDTYTMKPSETTTQRTVYYYVEITNTLDGKTGVTYSAPCAVAFINKNELDPRSYTMVDIPAGTVALNGEMDTWGLAGYYFDDFITPGFKMGQCPVTWELWETVFKYADGANFRFAREGNQGGAFMGLIYGTNTNLTPWPVGNALNPVTVISWRDVLVWCNAYSEMDGLDPVYRDSEGNVLRDSRKIIDYLVDYDAIENVVYNGYRLPSYQEWVYAARGANPLGSHWNDNVPGINTGDVNVASKYLWALSPEVAPGGVKQTGEVGKLLPNQIWNGITYVDGLYDMMGLVNHWIDMPLYQQTRQENVCIGEDFNNISIPAYAGALTNTKRIALGDFCRYTDEFVGFRVARNRGE
jgi:formylglycine-generating enzyme required for sulfatase activity